MQNIGLQETEYKEDEEELFSYIRIYRIPGRITELSREIDYSTGASLLLLIDVSGNIGNIYEKILAFVGYLEREEIEFDIIFFRRC